jgi:hypothetical protein
VTYVVDFRGRPACPCLAAWLPVYEAELHRRGLLDGPLPIYQLIGGAAASGGTHASGGAFDISDLTGDVDVWVARQMGADATWARTRAQGFTPHLHGVLTGCPHNEPARYQIDDVQAGWNGLAGETTRARDDGPRPLSGRTWREGIAWAIEQGDDMPYTKDELKAIVREVVDEVLAERQGNDFTLAQNIRRAGDTKELAKEIARELATAQRRVGK